MSLSSADAKLASARNYLLSRFALSTLLTGILAAAIVRFAAACIAAGRGDFGPATAFGFVVIFPLVLAALLLALPPTQSLTGVWMRIAAVLDLFAIISFPSLSLVLLLGLPVTFLIVEIFETRASSSLRKVAMCWLVRSR